MPDLNILDCIYILARPSYGPWCTYAEATQINWLLAGVDPVALDLWATINLLVPTIIENGYTNYPMQDPFEPSSIFRTYLDATTQVLLASGIVEMFIRAKKDEYVGPFSGQVAGLIREIKPAADILMDMVAGAADILARKLPESVEVSI